MRVEFAAVHDCLSCPVAPLPVAVNACCSHQNGTSSCQWRERCMLRCRKLVLANVPPPVQRHTLGMYGMQATKEAALLCIGMA